MPISFDTLALSILALMALRELVLLATGRSGHTPQPGPGRGV
jgi:hypothetical protein